MSYCSHADLGGQKGAGQVVPDPDDELFHAQWERYALALTLAMRATGAWNIDMFRSACETLPDYTALTYYGVWVRALEQLLIEGGLIVEDELVAGRMLRPPAPLPSVLRATEVARVVAKGRMTERSATSPARFKVGEDVRTRQSEVQHHTRLPGYARGKIGRVEQIRGVHVFADANAQGLGEHPQWLYSVVFEGRQLWGDDAPEGLSVSIDAWEPYLEPLA
ncbi:nitrile hydratase subunit beta [Trinickia violacea]|uniref:Nitrile hydratase subunit beta n=1 Tax=Trinickia violacea TaxID=2571746 RepID=A0A4P8IUM4_9BURK|nr:nitrile hydratase subunit beta [Trinickia violacea]QCP52978.1 nitrile hydratase subunit beta [Trinickia violacea]